AGIEQVNQVAKAFTDFYYQAFDQNNRASLRGLYKDISMMTFETSQVQGIENIIAKLTSLPFTKIQRKIATLDAQPSNPTSGTILIMVTGQLLIDDEKNPQHFSQSFQLVPDGPGNYFIFN
ncbi:Nuclear transport factor 2, partial [Clydaea vesicula]